MSNARQLAANLPREGGLSNRNLIINGAMQVAQRGASTTITAASATYSTVDRFRGDFFGASWVATNHTTEEQSTDAPDGFDRSHKFTALTAQDYSNALGSWIQYTFENQDITQLQNGTGLKEFTVSLWLKASKTGNVTVSFENDYSYSTYVSINSANTWEHKTVTIPATSSNMGIDYSNDPSGGDLKLKIGMGSNGSWLVDTDNQWNNASTNRGVLSSQQTNFHASVNDYIAITGVQLEVGDTATPFEHRSYGDELQRCQRYFCKVYASARAYTGDGYWGVQYPFPTSMRVNPTYADAGGGNNYLPPVNQGSINTSPNQAGIQFYGSGAGTFYTYGRGATFDAEL